MKNNPCEIHFDKPCIVYAKGDKECMRVEMSSKYEKQTCLYCGWTIATVKDIKCHSKPKEVRYSGYVHLPERLKLKFNPFIDLGKV